MSVTAFLIMTVWALGEALEDVRSLLDGGRIPFLKNRSQWKISLDQLLDIGRNGRLPGGETTGSGGNGLNYKGYLRILIFGGYGIGMIYRMMDIMEINIARGQSGFSMGHCACRVDTESTVSGKHVFFSTGLWKNRWETVTLIMKPVLGHPAATWMIPGTGNSRKGGSWPCPFSCEKGYADT